MNVSSIIKEKLQLQLLEYKQLFERLLRIRMTKCEDGQRSSLLSSLDDLEKEFASAEKKMFEILKELEEYHNVQELIRRSMKLLEKKKELILDLVIPLRKIETKLNEVVEEGKRKLEIIEEIERASPDVESLIAYSHRVSVTTSAPLHWSLNQSLLMFTPPAPMEDEMRSGILYTKLDPYSYSLFSNKFKSRKQSP